MEEGKLHEKVYLKTSKPLFDFLAYSEKFKRIQPVILPGNFCAFSHT